jgi:non-ribosomal peptide synthase protein (TIGR01720 family)
MVPAGYVFLEKLPLTANGKVDRKALPAPVRGRSEGEAGFVAPRNTEEEILAQVWMQLLGLQRVGVNDNFFELGGDSILSIQVVSRARQAGLQFTARQLFEYPTIAGLAAVADAARLTRAEQGVVEGLLPLTPIQHWFFEQDLAEPHHWNQALQLKVHMPLDEDVFKAALNRILIHHDALRMRFKASAGGWEQVNAAPDRRIPFSRVDLSGLSPEQQLTRMVSVCAEMQSSLNLSEGPIFQVAYFDLGESRPGRLLMAFHHLIIDGFSWSILLEDLHAAYLQISQGQTVHLPPKTTSFREWAHYLVDYAQSPAISAQMDYWMVLARGCPERIPVDDPCGDNREGSARGVTVALTEEETGLLLHEAPNAYNASVLQLLLAALGQAVGRWTGHRSVLVDLEGHGREELSEQIDLSRTVGWFTALYPFQLTAGDGLDPGARVEMIKGALAAVPQNGIGYGLLRYLSRDEEIRSKLKALTQAQICFNYLGHYDQALEKSASFEFAEEPRGSDRSPHSQRIHLIDVNGGIFGGRLQMEWTYSQSVHRRSTIERVAEDFLEALRSILAQAGTVTSQGHKEATAAEFGWSQEDMEEIASAIGDLESED